MSLIFNSVYAFVEQVGRRKVKRFGQTVQMNFIYTGAQSAYGSWNPQLGSRHPDFPLMYLNDIEQSYKEAGVLEVTLSYLGTDQQNVTYTDLSITTDLLAKSFSWSGVAWIPASTIGGGGYIAQYTLEVQYTTVEVTFTYTTYKYENGAIFQSKASSFTQVIAFYAQETASRQISPGTYTGYPTITHPIKPLMTLSRYNCEQQTPTNQTNFSQSIWKCTETWGLNFQLGSLGLNTPNYVQSTP